MCTRAKRVSVCVCALGCERTRFACVCLRVYTRFARVCVCIDMKCVLHRSNERIDGILELLGRNKILLFTPTDIALYDSFQCIIGLDEIRALTHTFPNLCVQLHEWLEFEFADNTCLQELAKSILEWINRIESVSPSNILRRMSVVSRIPWLGEEGRPRSPPRTRRVPTRSVSVTLPPLFFHASDKPAIESQIPLLISSTLVTELQNSLPLEVRFHNWQLLFSPKIHGISIPSFYRHCEESPHPVVIIVTTAQRCCTFGAFCKKPFLPNCRKFFGSGENFLFRHSNTCTHIYTWTCANELFQFSDNRRIVIGGGSTGSALVVFDNWLRGTCAPCETFNPTEPLACTSEFVIGDIEFWGLKSQGSEIPVPPTRFAKEAPRPTHQANV